MTIYRPDFKKSYLLANEMLVKSQIINTFPFSITNMIKELTDIQCCSFKRAKNYGIDIEAYGSETAVLTEYSGNFV